jgi:hypothetical protein
MHEVPWEERAYVPVRVLGTGVLTPEPGAMLDVTGSLGICGCWHVEGAEVAVPGGMVVIVVVWCSERRTKGVGVPVQIPAKNCPTTTEQTN